MAKTLLISTLNRAMKRTDRERIKEIFAQALALLPEQRPSFLDAACQGDAALRQELGALLTHYEDAPAYFERLAGSVLPQQGGRQPHARATGSDPHRLVGQVVSHYHILEQLGDGGMGVVYKARDTKLDRTVALKFLLLALSTDDEAKARLVHEARAASSLDHPNIGAIHEINETADGRLFIAMAYYAGETLKQKIVRGPLPCAEALGYAVQVAEGLAWAHEAGIIHRDVKPANVLVTERGRVKIVDFGIAKMPDISMTQTGSTVGTVAYMSPEQAQGERVDHRTDIWSWGVVFYEMLTGMRPFQGRYEQAVLYSIVNKPHRPMAALRPEIPLHLQKIVARALAKRPEERYQHMNDVLADLHGTTVTRTQTQTIVRDKKSTPSIAVLSFVDMSSQKDQEYFCDGLAEELIDALAKLDGLQVAARTSTFQFKGKADDIRALGQRLNVATVLEGSVRKAGNRLRIRAQLVDVADGYHRWSETYDREVEDVFAIQEEIARTIVETLKVRLAENQEALLIKRYTENIAAYKLYLKGRYFWNKRHEGGIQQAMAYFKQAIDEEPAYALAYVGLADCYALLGWFMFAGPRETYPKAEALARQALAIDETLAEAHNTLGFIALVDARDWIRSEQAFQRTIELKPSYPMGHWWYAFFLMMRGRTDESFASIERALELDPLSIPFNSALGWLFYFARRYDEAIEQCRKTLEMEPNFGVAYVFLGWAYEQKGMYDEAVAALEQAAPRLGSGPFNLLLARPYALSGRTEEAQRLLTQSKALSTEYYISTYHVAATHLALGEVDQAFQWLAKAYEERHGWLAFLNVDPMFDSLRADPRFTALLKKAGL